MSKIQTGAHLDYKLRSLDSAASASNPAVDMAYTQSVIGKRGCDIQYKAVRSRMMSEDGGAEKQSWLWASTLAACS